MDTNAFINALSGKLERKPDEINILIGGLSSFLKENCADLSVVAIPGFGEFVPVKDDERIELDKESGKRMLLPPRVRLTFEPSSILKSKISANGGGDE